MNTKHKDSMGYPIPDGCVELWCRSGEVGNMIDDIKSIRSRLRLMIDRDDPLYRMLNPSAFDHLSRSVQLLEDCKPYAVCLYCSGTDVTKTHCSICRGTGLLSKFGYDFRTEPRMRELRKKQIRMYEDSNEK